MHSSGTVGWPKFTENNRHILSIHGSQRSSNVQEEQGSSMMWEPVSINVDKNEQVCAFWNNFVPSLESLKSQSCNSKKTSLRSKTKQKIFLPMAIRPRLTTTASPIPPSTQHFSKSNYIDDLYSNNLFTANENSVPRSRPATVLSGLQKLIISNKQEVEIPSSIIKSSVQDTRINKVSNQVTNVPPNVKTQTTELTTTSKSTTTTTRQQTTKTTTTSVRSTTASRMTTVTQLAHTMKRHPTVKFNPYIFISGAMQNNKKLNVPTLRKQDDLPNVFLNGYSEAPRADSDISDHGKRKDSEDQQLQSSGIIESTIKYDKQKVSHLLRGTSPLYSNIVSSPPIVNSLVTTQPPLGVQTKTPANATENKIKLDIQSIDNASNEKLVKNQNDENTSLKASELRIINVDLKKESDSSQFIKFGEGGKDSTLVKFRMRVMGNHFNPSIFPKSRIRSSISKKNRFSHEEFSSYNSNKPNKSAISISNPDLDIPGLSYASDTSTQPHALSSSSKSNSKLNKITENKDDIAISEAIKKNYVNEESLSTAVRPQLRTPYHKYPLPSVYDPFNSNTYLKSDSVKPHKTQSIESRNGANKITDYFRPRVQEYLDLNDSYQDTFKSLSTIDGHKFPKSYYPI